MSKSNCTRWGEKWWYWMSDSWLPVLFPAEVANVLFNRLQFCYGESPDWWACRVPCSANVKELIQEIMKPTSQGRQPRPCWSSPWRWKLQWSSGSSERHMATAIEYGVIEEKKLIDCSSVNSLRSCWNLVAWQSLIVTRWLAVLLNVMDQYLEVGQVRDDKCADLLPLDKVASTLGVTTHSTTSGT